MPGFGGGELTLRYRYALGSSDRTGSLIVNGQSRSLTNARNKSMDKLRA